MHRLVFFCGGFLLAGCVSSAVGDSRSAPPTRLLGLSRNPDSAAGRWRVDEKRSASVFRSADGSLAPFFAVTIAGESAPRLYCDLDVPPGCVQARCETGDILSLGTSEVLDVGPGSRRWELRFTHATLRAVGAAEGELRFSWADRRDGPYLEFASVPFRLYAILGTPVLPWVAFPDSDDNPHAPWVRALAIAATWAGGARTVDEVATRITRAVYALGTGPSPRLRWEGQVSHFCVNYAQIPSRNAYTLDRFDLARLLDVLEMPPAAPQEVDCNDVASTVYALSNLLGCSLTLMSIGIDRPLANRTRLRLHAVQPLGHDGFIEGLTLLSHQVAWSGSPSRNGFVYDASLGLYGPGGATPACGLRFGAVSEPDSYVSCLALDAPFLILIGTQNRPIAPLKFQESVLHR